LSIKRAIYEVGEERDVIEEEKENTSTFSFGAAGDWGVEEEADKTARNIKNHNVNLTIGLGDLSYKEGLGSPKYWTDLLKKYDLRSKTIICLGNHELVNDIVYNEYKQEFHEYNLPYYSYKYNNKLHVLIMSAEHDFEENSKQYRFIEQELKNSKCDWIIVCIHQAAYCSKSRHEPKECNSSPSTYPTRRYCLAKVYHHSLFEKYHVDLVLHGHNHNYERSYPIKFNDIDPSNPIKAVDFVHEYNNPNAPIFVTVGTAGRELYKFQDHKPAFIANRQDIAHGFLRVQVNEEEEQLKRKKLYAKFISNYESHQFDDWFTILKTDNNRTS
jgi:hypothetical protein